MPTHKRRGFQINIYGVTTFEEYTSIKVTQEATVYEAIQMVNNILWI